MQPGYNPVEGYLELPAGVDLVALVKKAYELSQPQGMGFLHYQPGPLPDTQAELQVRREQLTHPAGRGVPVHMDYVNGRAVKFSITRWQGKLYVPPSWYDHTHEQYRELLASVGVQLPAQQGGAA